MSLVSYSIRHFRNTDTAHLTRIWNLHHSASRACGPISNSVFDSCVIAKPFFVAEDLLILEEDSVPAGFVHVGYGGNETKSDIDHRSAMLACLCVAPHRDEANIADSLVQAAIDRIKQHSSNSVIAIGSPARYAFYIGMAAGDGLMGVLASDSRLQSWLVHNRFEPSRPTECWEVDLASFRPPMDRGQFAVRRAASVVRVLDEHQDQWWDAVVLGHTEQIRFQLFSREHSVITNDVSFWYTDQALSGIASNAARIWMPKFPDDSEGRDRYVFLLSEAFRQLQTERFSTIRAIAAPDQQASVSILQRLSFRSVEHGLVYERRVQGSETPKLA